MKKEYKNYRDMKGIKEIIQTKSEKISKKGNHLSEKIDNLLEYVQGKKK